MHVYNLLSEFTRALNNPLQFAVSFPIFILLIYSFSLEGESPESPLTQISHDQ